MNLQNSVSLFYAVEDIYTCQEKFIQDRDFPILLKAKHGVGYFNFDLKENNLVERNFLKLNNVMGIGWVSDKECLIVTDKSVTHYSINNLYLKQKSSHPNTLICGPNETIEKVWVVGTISEEQDCNIPIFYATVAKEKKEDQRHPHMKLRIKEFNRSLEGDVTEA